MSQPFNPKRVLRQISNPLLKEFFASSGESVGDLRLRQVAELVV